MTSYCVIPPEMIFIFLDSISALIPVSRISIGGKAV